MYQGVKRSAPFHRGAIAGLFGCEISTKDFEAENFVTVYPGKTNVWLFVRRKGSGPNIQEVTDRFIRGPFDTSWTTENVVIPPPLKIANDDDKVRLSMIAWGLRPQAKTLSSLTFPVNIGTDLEYWQVMFHPPEDAPTSVPWPLVGCAEEADWTLSGALSDVLIATGEKAPITNSATADRPASALDSERQKELSLAQLQAGRDFGLETSSFSFPSMSLTTWLLLGVGAVGAVWFVKERVSPSR